MILFMDDGFGNPDTLIRLKYSEMLSILLKAMLSCALLSTRRFVRHRLSMIYT